MKQFQINRNLKILKYQTPFEPLVKQNMNKIKWKVKLF